MKRRTFFKLIGVLPFIPIVGLPEQLVLTSTPVKAVTRKLKAKWAYADWSYEASKFQVNGTKIEDLPPELQVYNNPYTVGTKVRVTGTGSYDGVYVCTAAGP